MQNFRALGAPPPDPLNSPPLLQNFAYTPLRMCRGRERHVSLQNRYQNFVIDYEMKQCVKSFFKRPVVLIFRAHSRF